MEYFQYDCRLQCTFETGYQVQEDLKNKEKWQAMKKVIQEEYMKERQKLLMGMSEVNSEQVMVSELLTEEYLSQKDEFSK